MAEVLPAEAGDLVAARRVLDSEPLSHALFLSP